MSPPVPLRRSMSPPVRLRRCGGTDSSGAEFGICDNKPNKLVGVLIGLESRRAALAWD